MQSPLRFCVLLLASVIVSLHAAESIPATPGPRSYYAAIVNHDGLILDPAGTSVPVAEVPAFLKKADLVGIDAIALLIEGPETIKAMEPTIAAFDGGLSTIFVKVREPGDKLGRVEWPKDRTAPFQSGIGIARKVVVQNLPTPATGTPPPPTPAAATHVATSSTAELKLTAGQSAILVGGQRIFFPPGTTVCMSGGRTVNVNGHHNTVNAGPGAIVAVPLNATGEADNVVIAP